MNRIRRTIRAAVEAWKGDLDRTPDHLRISQAEFEHRDMNCQMGQWPHFGACMRGPMR